MKRREFITFLGGAAAAWPLAARAQQRDGMRLIGVLMGIRNDPEGRAQINALRQGLEELGWTEGRNLRIEYRWGAGDPNLMQSYATEIVGLRPDLIVAQTATALERVRQSTSKIPIVFVSVSDPISNGFVTSLARPGGNITGFTLFEYAMGGKWLELLKEIAPNITRVALVQNIKNPNWPGWLRETQSTAPALGLQLTRAAVHEVADIEPAIDAFARESNGAVIALPDPFTTANRDLIIALAARHRLPGVYPFRFWAASGGLMSYGIDQVDLTRRSANYVDRILRGEKPSELPIQAPTKFDLVINLKTAKALGLTVPPTLLTRADEVIE
jgi:putative ABC transport system substrate-binding protein